MSRAKIKNAKKLSENEFWKILSENAGLFTRTVRAIENQFKITITRQSVRERALKQPERYKEILEQNIDIAEEGLHSLMRSKSETVRLKAVELFLKTQGKSRGYVEKQQVEHSGEVKSVSETTPFIIKPRI